MHYLITIFRLDLTGSSTYTYTLVKELIAQHHQITIFSPFHAEMALPLQELGVQLIKHPKELATITPDIILGQHHVVAIIARACHPTIPMLHITHGVIDSLENPPSIDLNISKYMVVSLEAQQHLVNNLNIDRRHTAIIPNGIDVDHHQITHPIKPFPTQALFIASARTSYHRIAMLKDVCASLNIKLTIIGKDKRVHDIEAYIHQADLVISVGRGVLTAMACGKAALVYDHDHGDGMVTAENVAEIAKHNFSGRRFHLDFNHQTLSQEVQKYQQTMGEANRGIIERDFNIENIAEAIIKLSEQAVNNFKLKTLHIPHQELEWMYNNFIVNQIQEDWKTKIRKGLRKFL